MARRVMPVWSHSDVSVELKDGSLAPAGEPARPIGLLTRQQLGKELPAVNECCLNSLKDRRNAKRLQ